MSESTCQSWLSMNLHWSAGSINMVGPRFVKFNSMMFYSLFCLSAFVLRSPRIYDTMTACQSDWMTEQVAYWLIGWLAGCLADRWLTGWLADWLTDWLTDWLADWLTDWLIDGLPACPPECLTDCLSVWMIDGRTDGSSITRQLANRPSD